MQKNHQFSLKSMWPDWSRIKYKRIYFHSLPKWPKKSCWLMSWKLKHNNSSFLGYAAKEKCPQQWGHERDAEAGKTEPRRKTNAGMYERLTTGVVLGDRTL